MADDVTETDAAAHGRAAVRKYLIEPLEQAGMKRRKNMTEAAHRDWLGVICDRLAYMSPDCLVVLADELRRHGGGAKKDEWPPEVLICGWANGLQPRPLREAPIVTSWLRSIEGPIAHAGGYLVDLLRFLQRRGVPPTAYDMAKIKEEAAENARMASYVSARLAAGAASDADRRWLENRLRDEARARQLVDGGIEHRAQKSAQKGEAA